MLQEIQALIDKKRANGETVEVDYAPGGAILAVRVKRQKLVRSLRPAENIQELRAVKLAAA